MDNLNQNETLSETTTNKNGNDYGKLIKIGAAILAVILIFSLFGNKYARRAEDKIVEEFTEMLEDYGAKNIKVKTNVIGKNKDAGMYCVDTTAKCKYEGETKSQSSYILVYSDKEGTVLVRQFEYTKENKRDIRDIALASLAKG